jgi:hypothetical protein
MQHREVRIVRKALAYCGRLIGNGKSQLTAATTVKFCVAPVGLKQLSGLCSIMLSCTGNPPPLLLYNCVAPLVRVIITLKAEIDVLVGICAENP